jgi:hypothetical protein
MKNLTNKIMELDKYKEQEKTWTKLFLCQEGTELFEMKAKDMEQAQEFAQTYNAVVIKELKK